MGKVAKELGKVYEKSNDETLRQLAKGYRIMEKEAKYLAKLVEKQLPEYDKEILRTSAIIMDDWVSCGLCQIAYQLAIGAGCFIICIISFGTLCFICLALIGFPYELLIDYGVDWWCQYIGMCP